MTKRPFKTNNTKIEHLTPFKRPKQPNFIIKNKKNINHNVKIKTVAIINFKK